MSKAAESIWKHYHHLHSDIAEKVVERIGQPPDKAMQHLGTGSRASAYWMADKTKVFKITADYEDGQAMAALKVHPKRGFVRVYDVFEIRQPGNVRFWGIVAEKATPLNRVESDHWEVLDDVLADSERLTDGKYDLYDDFHKMGLSQKFVARFREAVARTPAMQQELAEVPRWQSYFYTNLETWAKGLDELGVNWSDLVPENIMKSGRELILTDLGHSWTTISLKLPVVTADD
jgi:hypothetical protein